MSNAAAEGSRIVTCLDEPRPAPYWRWLHAALVGDLLKVCTAHGDDVDQQAVRLACVGLRWSSGTLIAVSSSASPNRAPHGTFAVKDGMHVACAADGTCRALGTQAARYVGDPQSVSVSADGALVVLHGGGTAAVWDVAGDRGLDLFPPSGHIDPNYLGTVTYEFLDGAVVGSWTPCAGPCTVYRIFRRDGEVIADDVDDSHGFLGLPGSRIAVFRDQLEIYDARQATLLRSIGVVPAGFARIASRAPADGEVPDPLVLLPDGRVAVVIRSEAAIEVVIASAIGGTVTRRIRIPICTPAREPGAG